MGSSLLSLFLVLSLTHNAAALIASGLYVEGMALDSPSTDR